MKEVFKQHKSGYFVSNQGRIKGIRVAYLRPTLSNAGYLVTSLPKDGTSMFYTVHRAVYETFKGDIPHKMDINHIDGNKQNNHISNLECVTRQENIQHAYDNGLAYGKPGSHNSMAKLTAEDFIILCESLMEGATNDEIAQMFGIHPNYVSLIRHKKRWTSLFPPWYKPTKSLGNTGISLDKMVLVYKDTLTTLSNKEIAVKWSLDPSTISRIRTRKTWVDFIKYYESCSATTISGG